MLLKFMSLPLVRMVSMCVSLWLITLAWKCVKRGCSAAVTDAVRVFAEAIRDDFDATRDQLKKGSP